VTWEEYRHTVQTCRNRVRNVKAHSELNLVREMKGHKKASTATSVAQ